MLCDATDGFPHMTDSLKTRKGRGAFFTPSEISQFLVNWALRSPRDSALEPSCGEASFLIQAARRLFDLGAQPWEIATQLHGIEIHANSAEVALSLIKEHGLSASVEVADFFEVEPRPIYSAVIGNPPYVRYQQFNGSARIKALEAALSQGVRLTGLSSSWAAFVVHAARFLRTDGRLALVLPAELLSVNYASQVRRFLLQRFSSIRLILFETRVFPEVLEEVVLLLAEGSGGASSFEVYQARDLADLENLQDHKWACFTPEPEGKWTPALLPDNVFSAYQRITNGGHFCRMLEWGETYLGAVTGNNKYFALTKCGVAELGLRPQELLPISPPGSRHIRGLRFAKEAWERLADEGARCYLFVPNRDKPSAAAWRYIEAGEKANVHKAYKCRNRSPWWRVPTVSIPDLLLTYMDHERPRLTTNDANVNLLNSLYGILLKKHLRRLGRELLPIACLNSVTILGAEIVGRSYGGGMLKLEPTEADQLPVPSKSLLTCAAESLRALRPQLSVPFRQGKLGQAIEMVDRVLLGEIVGLTDLQITVLRQARHVLFGRRIARGKGNRGSN